MGEMSLDLLTPFVSHRRTGSGPARGVGSGDALVRASPGIAQRLSVSRLVDASALLPSFGVVLRIPKA
jgi:hypothetical protein